MKILEHLSLLADKIAEWELIDGDILNVVTMDYYPTLHLYPCGWRKVVDGMEECKADPVMMHFSGWRDGIRIVCVAG
jgi:hypothetical protein